MRRRRLVPDDRPSWRDPEMPVVNKFGQLVPAEGRHQHAIAQLEKLGAPNWRHDPTYDLKRRKDKRK